jgi:AcrR family transcriptional regulator
MPIRRSGNPPGRPKAFCEREALEAAILVFADKGFEGTSLTDLTKAMGINRFSLYATYGNKEALYLKAMERFNECREAHLLKTLSAPTAREGVSQLLRDSVTNFTDNSGAGSCFVTQGPLIDEETSDRTRRRVAEMRASVEKLIRERLEQAIKDGELPESVSAADLARFVAVTIQGFALQAQHGGTRDELLKVIAVFMQQWPKREKSK